LGDIIDSAAGELDSGEDGIDIGVDIDGVYFGAGGGDNEEAAGSNVLFVNGLG